MTSLSAFLHSGLAEQDIGTAVLGLGFLRASAVGQNRAGGVSPGDARIGALTPAIGDLTSCQPLQIGASNGKDVEGAGEQSDRSIREQQNRIIRLEVVTARCQAEADPPRHQASVLHLQNVEVSDAFENQAGGERAPIPGPPRLTRAVEVGRVIEGPG